MKIYDVIVVGLGAAGLFAMANLDAKLNVLGIERNRKAGLKLAITGGGRCNLTNDDNLKKLVAAYTDPSFVRPIIYGFNNCKTVQYFEQSGLPLIVQNGRFYPKSQIAQDVVAHFLKQIEKRGHHLQLNETVVDIITTEPTIKLSTNVGSYHCKHLIVATGGATYPQTGSDGKLLQNCFDISAFQAALSPLYIAETLFKGVKGVSLAVAIKYGQRHFSGDLLFGGDLLTGPVIYDLSNYIAAGEQFLVDFAPQISRQAMRQEIKKMAVESPKKSLKNALLTVLNLPQSVVKVLIAERALQDVQLANLKAKDLTALIDTCKALPLTAKAKLPLAKATVSKGGIKTGDIDNKTMCLKKDDRISIVGEAIELVGACGGYSLQFAFSSAYRAVQKLNR